MKREALEQLDVGARVSWAAKLLSLAVHRTGESCKVRELERLACELGAVIGLVEEGCANAGVRPEDLAVACPESCAQFASAVDRADDVLRDALARMRAQLRSAP